MMIKDLEISKELNGAELSAVRGGSTNNAFVIGAGMYTGGALIAAQNAPVSLGQYAGDENYSYTSTTANALNIGLGNSLGQFVL